MMQSQQDQLSPAEIVAKTKQNFSNQNKDWSTATLNEKLDSLKNDTHEPNVVKAGILLVSETFQQNVVRASEDLQQNVVTALQFVTGALANQPPVWFQNYCAQQEAKAKEKQREKQEKAKEKQRKKEEKAKEKQRKREREEKEKQDKQERKKQRLENEDERWAALVTLFQHQQNLQRLQQAIEKGKQLRM